jgi:hypothetical protein
MDPIIADKIWKDLNQIEYEISQKLGKKAELNRGAEITVAYLLKKIYELEEKIICSNQTSTSK